VKKLLDTACVPAANPVARRFHLQEDGRPMFAGTGARKQ